MGNCCPQDDAAAKVSVSVPIEGPPTYADVAVPAYQEPPPPQASQDEPATASEPPPAQPPQQPEPEPPKAEPVAAPEPAPVPPAAAKGLLIELAKDGARKTIDVTEAPLGLSFPQAMPLVISKVDENGAAGKLGAEIGWELTSIGGQSLAGLDYAAALNMLKSGAAKLTPSADATAASGAASKSAASNEAKLIIEFSTRSGTKSVTFTKKPLGMVFDPKVPVIIKKTSPGSHAEELGVEVGWQVTAVGSDKCDGLDFNAIKALIVRGSGSLQG